MDDLRQVLTLAALTGPVPKAGVIAVTLLAAAALVLGARRQRAAAMLAALVLSPVLLAAEVWHSPQLQTLHRHAALAAVALLLVGVLVVAGATVIGAHRGWAALLAVAALPFRVPIQAGGRSANLLVPLYIVVAAATLAWIWDALGKSDPADARHSPQGRASPGRSGNRRSPGALERAVSRLLALYLVLYGVQATYSAGFETALQNVVFFYVPFALLYCVLREVPWSARLLRDCLLVTVALALAFSLLGFYEYATRTIILNSRLALSNELHTYFTVNSVFFDPDIFGRYLALTMILVSVWLIYDRAPGQQGLAAAALAVLWACLVLTLSRSSLGALLLGMGVLAALRYRPGRALVAAVAVVVAGGIAVAVSPKTFGLNQGINGASSGRGGLVSGGLDLFAQRPLLGWGSGSFVTEYRRHDPHRFTALSASHTIPITVAAEQGLIGEAAYAAFVAAAIALLVKGARGDPVRSAVAAAFIALVFHTLLYADFLEDPTTWTLLAVGVSLAAAPIATPASPSGRRALSRLPGASAAPGGS
ncbi:MAG TPA: O-antigen ligase family protein [Solirubrobacteraceae bacterium]|nr:O-antigen ligase family protein [Solirubrobacteraceae bacterium]